MLGRSRTQQNVVVQQNVVQPQQPPLFAPQNQTYIPPQPTTTIVYQEPVYVSTLDRVANFQNNIHVIESTQGVNSSVEIEQYTQLGGLDGLDCDPNKMYLYQRLNQKLKRVKITLNNGGFKTRQGALHYMLGDVEISAKKEKIGKKIKPHYKGNGIVYLEASWKHFLIVRVEENRPVVVDRGIWFASEDTVKVERVMVKGLGTMLFGGEGLFQQKCTGSGWVVLELEVPPEEVQRMALNNQSLKVDGNFAILRIGDVDFTVTNSNKNILHKTGEGLLQTFKGTGEVWLCPTMDFYPEYYIPKS